MLMLTDERGHITPMPEFLTIKQVAKLAGCSTRTVLRMEQAGRIPKPKRIMGRHRAYSKADVRAIVDYRTKPA